MPGADHNDNLDDLDLGETQRAQDGTGRDAGDTLDSAPTLRGETILAGRYRIIRELGRGAMGTVYLATDRKLDDRPVAVKMPAAVLARNPRAVRNLKQEALLAMQLSHPHIVTLRSFEETADGVFLVMDYVDGRTLEEVLSERGTLPEEEVLRLFRPVAEAIDFAHSKKVIHRDIKPSNILIAADGTPLVTDFGIAREMRDSYTRTTGKVISGTLPYMSPEQLRGDAPAPAQDVYSLAATIYECLTGNPPFHRGEIAHQIMNLAPARPERGGAVVDAVMAGLSKQPQDRPTSCRALVGGTATLSGGRGDRAESRPRARKRLLPLLLAVLAILAAVGIYAWVGLRNAPPKTTLSAEKGGFTDEEIAELQSDSMTPSPALERLAERLPGGPAPFSAPPKAAAVTPTPQPKPVETPVAPPKQPPEEPKPPDLPAAARDLIKDVEAALEGYRMDFGHYPTSEEGGLHALLMRILVNDLDSVDRWRGPYLKEEPRDPWGNLLNYKPVSPDTHEAQGGGYLLWSNGPDGISGTQDDIKNWSDTPKPPASAYDPRKFEAPNPAKYNPKDWEKQPQPPAPASPESRSSPKEITLDLGGGVTMKCVLIPAGKFLMGSPASEANRDAGETQHEVMITKPFYMGVTEVTQAQYEAVMGTNPSDFKGATNPVDTVSWNDAAEFCKKLSEKTRQAVRLPTEAEWEYACRAGSKTGFSLGDADEGMGDYAWYSSNSGSMTHPVGQKKPNAWDLFDMHGNVWEWCADCYGDYPKGAVTDPQGPASVEYRVLRGGSWSSIPGYCRSAYRHRFSPDYRYYFYGFRVVVVVSAPGL